MNNNIILSSYYFASLTLTQDIIVFFSEYHEALDAVNQVKFFNPSCNIHYLEDLNFLTNRHNNPRDLNNIRSTQLHKIALEKKPKIIFTTISNLFCPLPCPNKFSKDALKITIGTKIDTSFLAELLIDSGFIRVSSIISSCEFAIRGEIIDIATSDNFYRLILEWNIVKSIKTMDPVSQISQNHIDNIIIYPNETIGEKFIEKAKIRLLNLIGHTARKHNIFYKLEQHNITAETFYPLVKIFTDKTANILSYLSNDLIIYTPVFYNAAIIQMHNMLEKQYQQNRFLLSFEDVLFSAQDIFSSLDKFKIHTINKIYESNVVKNIADKYNFNFEQSKWESVLELLNIYKDKIIVFCAKNNDNLRIIKNNLQNSNLNHVIISNIDQAVNNVIYIALLSLEQGCLMADKYIFISCKDFITNTIYSPNKPKSGFSKLQNILAELENLKSQDLVVHKKYGIGKFIKIETINIKDCLHDCLKIAYHNNDTLYVPVENIKLIKKYGCSSDASLDKLGNSNWAKRKELQQNKIGLLAEELIKIAAIRSLSKTDPHEINEDLYQKFIEEFPYQLTQDQTNGILDIRNDLSSGKLMDRLICGDVGFGKTEVIMHAVFLLTIGNIYGKKQVVVVVPTMTLAKQHYLNFVKRFKKFDVNIVQLSRLVKPAELKKNKLLIEENKADIIIGTHSALSSNLKFPNLGLVVVDEEQHFGVGQKEKLKHTAANVHSIQVSATPIPRTLQISMTGVKDLSLIVTPPEGRTPIKTMIEVYSDESLLHALSMEMARGGQSFYVCPRIQHLEKISQTLARIIPQAKVKMLHGQMKSQIIEENLNDFYEGRFDILLSTNIIESGLDISKANTIIIDKVEMLGLSQLYQLRGRVGRNNMQGYAYLFFDKDASFTPQAVRRLNVMENIDYLGAGFTIASHDMEIRGFGNILGPEQAGHIKEIGVELYQEMLDEAINTLKFTENKINNDTEVSINLAIDVYIPQDYVEDGNARLALYKRIGSFDCHKDVILFVDEMEDRFGKIPLPMHNLLEMIELKNQCKDLGIIKIDAGEKGFNLQLCENSSIADKLIEFATKFPSKIKIKPDNKVAILTTTSKDNVLEKTRNLLQHFLSDNNNYSAAI